MENLKKLHGEVTEEQMVRIHFHEFPYREIIQRAISEEPIAIRAVAHCLFWGKGGLKNREYAASLLRKLVVEKSDIVAEYLLAHYAIIDGDTEIGRRQIRKLTLLKFQPAITLDAYLTAQESLPGEKQSAAISTLVNSGQSGHIKAWFLLLKCASKYPFAKRFTKTASYTLQILKSNPFKKIDGLREAEKSFLFD